MAIVEWYAPVAQLDSAIDSDSIGRRFEPCRAYQKYPHKHCVYAGILFLFGQFGVLAQRTGEHTG